MRLSVVYPFYRNSRMLGRHLQIWKHEWPASLKAHCEVVIIDDGSPEPAVDEVRTTTDIGIPISVYRILEDRPWHQDAARNLGAHVAQAPWLLCSDIDHVIPADTLGEVLRLIAAESGDRVYTFARRDAPAGEPWKADQWPTMASHKNARGELKPHANSFALSRELYWRAGGYDESYAGKGIYGTDGMFLKRLYKLAPQCHLPNWPLIRVSRDVIPDASTTSLERTRDPAARDRIAREKAARGETDVIRTLQFQWERVL